MLWKQTLRRKKCEKSYGQIKVIVRRLLVVRTFRQSIAHAQHRHQVVDIAVDTLSHSRILLRVYRNKDDQTSNHISVVLKQNQEEFLLLN